MFKTSVLVGANFDARSAEDRRFAVIEGSLIKKRRQEFAGNRKKYTLIIT